MSVGLIDVKEKNLTLELSRKFEEPLNKRFSYLNAQEEGKYKAIKEMCPICFEHLSEHKNDPCSGCPFEKFSVDGESLGLKNMVRIDGCKVWMNSLVPELYGTIWSNEFKVFWQSKDDKKAESLLNRLIKKAYEFIKWV